MSKPITRKKRLSLPRKEIPFREVGNEVYRLVRLRRERHGESSKQAYDFISKKYPLLYKRYTSAKRGPWISRAADDLDFLATFLNEGGEVSAELREVLGPIVDFRTTSHEKLQNASERLAERLSALRQSCYAQIAPGKRPAFYWASPDGQRGQDMFYGKVLMQLQNEKFWRLKRCPHCQLFFVADDHRQNYCPKKGCAKEQRKKSSQEGMGGLRKARRKEAVNLAAEFIDIMKRHEPILDDLSREMPEPTFLKIKDGIERKWSGQRIVQGLSGKGRNWLVREYAGN